MDGINEVAMTIGGKEVLLKVMFEQALAIAESVAVDGDEVGVIALREER